MQFSPIASGNGISSVPSLLQSKSTAPPAAQGAEAGGGAALQSRIPPVAAGIARARARWPRCRPSGARRLTHHSRRAPRGLSRSACASRHPWLRLSAAPEACALPDTSRQRLRRRVVSPHLWHVRRSLAPHCLRPNSRTAATGSCHTPGRPRSRACSLQAAAPPTAHRPDGLPLNGPLLPPPQVRHLNRGAFGMVVLAKDAVHGDLVALKYINRGAEVRGQLVWARLCSGALRGRRACVPPHARIVHAHACMLPCGHGCVPSACPVPPHPLPRPLPHHISQRHPTGVHCCPLPVRVAPLPLAVHLTCHTPAADHEQAQHTCYCCSLHLPQNISKHNTPATAVHFTCRRTSASTRSARSSTT